MAAKTRVCYLPQQRSYVKRSRSFSAQQEKDYERLASDYLIPFDEQEPQLIKREHYFARQPLIVEIGCGSGEATWQIAAQHPESSYLAIDVYRPGLLKLMRSCKERQLTNVKIIVADAVTVLNHGIAPNSLAGIHLFFPDPWPKSRHHRRRLLQGPMLDLLADRLTAAGYLYFVTDWQHYAQQANEQLQNHCSWQVSNPDSQFSQPRPQTSFERKALLAGRAIYEHFFHLCPAAERQHG